MLRVYVDAREVHRKQVLILHAHVSWWLSVRARVTHLVEESEEWVQVALRDPGIRRGVSGPDELANDPSKMPGNTTRPPEQVNRNEKAYC